jgi:glycosyltransferase involved in cell wall biosynthesis
MMHLFVNCLAASAASGLTYVRNVVPHFSRRPDLRVTLLLSPQLRKEFGSLPNLSFVEMNVSTGAALRFCWEQTFLPRIVRKSRADVLLSTGNFAIRQSPVPQILLSGNSLYTSSDFYDDLRARRAYRLWMDTRVRGFLARRSVRWSDCTVAPSRAFADTLHTWTGGKVIKISHGFDPETFFKNHGPLPPAIQEQIDSAENALRLVFVSHYNYYRNFETLLRAIPFIKQKLGVRSVRLFLTCKLSSDESSGAYQTAGVNELVRQLGISTEVVELGMIPYGLLHHVVRACDIYVTPAYTETFAHPLVEAMACGLPIVASDLPIHREICGNAAAYFARFSPKALADCVLQLEQSPELRRQLSHCASERSRAFSWQDHVDQIIGLARDLQGSATTYPRAA